MLLSKTFLFVSFLISYILGDEVNKIVELGVPVYGQIDVNGGVHYFQVTIPDNVEKETSDLVIEVRESDKPDPKKEMFYDPDIFVSQTNKNPSSPYNSKWYSQRYGEDILAISSKHIFAKEVFYLGVNCQFKCSYKLVAMLVADISIEAGTIYSTYLPNKTGITYKLKTGKGYDELEIMAISNNLMPIGMIVSDRSPGTGNDFPRSPSWFGGITVDIVKGSKEYCEECVLHILVTANYGDSEVGLIARYLDTITTVRHSEPLFASLKPYRSHCYSFYILPFVQKETLIFQTTLFSGSAILQIEGWNPVDKISPKDLTWTDWTFEINSERIVALSKKDMESFSKNSTEEFIYFCVTSEEFTSYSIKVFYESQTENLQKFNFLNIGKSVTGYLPKGQVTKYRILDFSRQANIQINLDSRTGDPILYGYICEDMTACHFTSQFIDHEKATERLISPRDTGLGYEVNIPDANNTCHKRLNSSASIEDQLQSVICGALAVVKCQGEDECVYKVRAVTEKSPLKLTPRTSVYQMIPFNDTDYYYFTIDNDDVKNVAVVLNSISGDTNVEISFQGKNYLAYKGEGDAYVPEVIRLNREKLNTPSIKGTYNVKVVGSTFAAYLLYYYTYDDANSTYKPDFSDVSVQLMTGHIIKDFLPNDTWYKIYSYMPDILPGNKPSDLRITFTRQNTPCSLYVFKDLDKFTYNITDQYYFMYGYTWKSNYNDEIVIRKDDPEYDVKSQYYIIVARDYYYNTNSSSSNLSTASYYLGVTNENSPFILYEGVPHSATLDTSYSSQTYWYTHPDISEPFGLSLNMFFGRANIYIGFKEMQKTEDTTLAVVKIEDTDTTHIDISTETLKEKCEHIFNCGIYILISKSSWMDAQYLLVAKSRTKKQEVLIPSLSRVDTVDSADYNYYIIEEYDNKKGGILSVSFTSGYGELYVKIPPVPEYGANLTFPNETQYDYKASDNYMGKLIILPPAAFEKCNPCQIQISVFGKQVGYESQEIEYNIIYINQAVRINQNQQYRSTIGSGEMQYFTFYFGHETKNIYISLSNMDGDADLYLNYGEEFPTFDDYDWFSSNPYHEFIDINKNDRYFTTIGSEDISGNYTLLIYGYVKTSYTLFVTAHPKKITPVSENSPGSCLCKTADHYCYFRFDGQLALRYEEVTQTMLLATTDYVYGTGEVYAKLYNDTDFDIIDNFPSSENYDYSTVVQGTRNFLALSFSKQNKNFTADSMLLLSVKCREKSLVDVNIARQFEGDFKYLDVVRENLFYLMKNYNQVQNSTLLSFYNYQDKDLHFEVFSYFGKANFLVYMNDTTYDSKTGASSYSYNHIASFKLQPPSDTCYYNTIKYSPSTTGKNIYFQVDPESTIGFYVKLNYELQWTKIKIGKTNSFKISNDQFYGYFDMIEDYKDVLLSVGVDDPSSVAYIYVKVNIFTKEPKSLGGNLTDAYNMSIPGQGNYDYMGQTNHVLQSVSLKINEIPAEQKAGKFIRVLFLVHVTNLASSEFNEKINIMVSPSMNNHRRIEAEQNTFYYSNEKQVDVDTTIFDMKRNIARDNILVVEISECKGTFSYKMSDKMTIFKNGGDEVEVGVIKSNGRTVLTLHPMKQTNYFLTIQGKSEPFTQCMPNQDTAAFGCDKDVQYVMWYYTTNFETYIQSITGKVFDFERVGRGEVLLNIPKIVGKDGQGNVRDQKNLAYQTFISNNIIDFQNMESVCYLSKMNPLQEGQNSVYDNQTNTIRVSGLEPGKKYFVNVLVHNLETGELLTFRPIEVIADRRALPVLIIVIGVSAIIVLVLIACYFYRKYKTTKAILKYEITDVRNMSTVPKSEAELKSITTEREAKKYATLTEDPQSV